MSDIGKCDKIRKLVKPHRRSFALGGSVSHLFLRDLRLLTETFLMHR